MLLALLFLSNTCQTRTEDQKQRVVTISVDADEAPIVPNVDEGSSYTQYGPGQAQTSSTHNGHEKLDTVGIIIGPSADFDTGVMDYVACLQKNDIKINFVAGIGGSSVIAAILSQTKKPELVKWKFFRLKDRKDTDSILEQLQINTRSIKRSNIAFYLTSLRDGNNIVFDTKGSIVRNIEQNINANKEFLGKQLQIDKSEISQLVAQKIFVFNYTNNLTVSKNEISDKIINIMMPKQNYSLMKKCEIIKENL